MATFTDVLAAVQHVKNCTTDPSAWRAGLSDDVVSALQVPMILVTMPPDLIDAILATIHRNHPTLFDPDTGAPLGPPTPPMPADTPQSGTAVDAMKDAEATLAQQNSETAEFDRQMLEAILTAHKTTQDGQRRLDQLEADIETAVRSRKLDTPMGAREFQRYLIGRLKDILAVVAEANDSDTSRQALLAALAALYHPDAATGRPVPPTETSTHTSAPEAGSAADPAAAPFFDAPPEPDDDPLESAAPAPAPAPPAAAAAPVSPPALGGAPGGGMPMGLPFSPASPAGLEAMPLDAMPKDLDEAMFTPADLSEDSAPEDLPEEDPGADDDPTPEVGPTTVTLPNGETVTAASPQLAAVIKSAAEGTPVADAFAQQGITVWPPGTAVSAPIEVSQVIPGDVGTFTDRLALAIGNDEALLDGQIQRIANVNGPSFLGWQHPPAPAAAVPTDPAVTHAPISGSATATV